MTRTVAPRLGGWLLATLGLLFVPGCGDDGGDGEAKSDEGGAEGGVDPECQAPPTCDGEDVVVPVGAPADNYVAGIARGDANGFTLEFGDRSYTCGGSAEQCTSCASTFVEYEVTVDAPLEPGMIELGEDNAAVDYTVFVSDCMGSGGGGTQTPTPTGTVTIESVTDSCVSGTVVGLPESVNGPFVVPRCGLGL